MRLLKFLIFLFLFSFINTPQIRAELIHRESVEINGDTYDVYFDSNNHSHKTVKKNGYTIIPLIETISVYIKTNPKYKNGKEPYIIVWNKSDGKYVYDYYDMDGQRFKIPDLKIDHISFEEIFGNDVLSIRTIDGFYYLYDLNGNCLVDKSRYISMESPHNFKNSDRQYTLINADYKGVIDSNLKWVAPMTKKYIDIKIDENKNCLTAKSSNSYDIIDIESGKIRTLPYSHIKFHEGSNIAEVKKEGLWGLFDLDNNVELVAPDFDDIELFSGTNLVKYKLNGFWGVMDLNGKEIIPTTRGYTAINYVKGLKKYTYSMNGFKGECNSVGTQLSKIAVPTNNSSASTHNSFHTPSTNTSTTSTSNTSSSQNQGNQVREYTETVPVQVWQACGGCNGSGQCQVCYGSGWTYSSSSYNGRRTCSACHGTGKCTSCAGQGGQNVVRYEQRTVYR